ncbi:MAG: RNase H family protein [Pirellulales bacterium]
MSVPAPHFLLHARANRAGRSGRWCFSLQSHDGSHSMKIEDAEAEISGERLELLALVRGLEALPQPAQVTVVAESPYLNRMLNGGLEEWRANEWRWEHHGEMVPVKNADLWRRVDRALHFHEIRLGSRAGASEPTRRARDVAPTCRVALRPGDGARRATRDNEAPRMLARRPIRHHKSLARKVLETSVILRRRLRQCCRRWSQAIEGLAADGERCAWAD